MGLTRIRAGQISDIDYKQSCRVLTASDIALSGGAPSTVDDINLVKGNRVLVTGQSNKAQNGIYVVETLGTGSNGTWIRSTDGNQDGEIEAGMIVMVTEGTVYKDTQWKLITNDPIVIGVSELIFELNSAFAFGNIYANGTAVLANTVGDAVTFTAGNNISISGNAQSQTINFEVVGISLNSISNGTSNVNVISSGGNITVGVGGASNVGVFSTNGLYLAGRLSASGNITGGNILGNGAGLTGINVFSNVTVQAGNSVVANSISDTLTLVAGDGLSIIADSSTDTITFAITGGSEIFVNGANFGTIEEPVTLSDDLGLVTELVDQEADLGSIVMGGSIYPDQFVLPSYTVAQLANLAAIPAGSMVFCSDESGGSVPVFADSTNWRRVTDRAVVS